MNPVRRRSSTRMSLVSIMPFISGLHISFTPELVLLDVSRFMFVGFVKSKPQFGFLCERS